MHFYPLGIHYGRNKDLLHFRFHNHDLMFVHLTVYIKSMLAHLLENLNDVTYYTPLNTQTLNAYHEMNIIRFI
jgi:hypothetical protein